MKYLLLILAVSLGAVAAEQPIYKPLPNESAESAAIGQKALEASYEFRELKRKLRRGLTTPSQQIHEDLAACFNRWQALVLKHGTLRPKQR